LIGVGVILLPGFIFELWKAINQRNARIITLILWVLGYIGLYALRLPVTYQYGRYIMPTMPIFFIIGLCGTIQIINDFKNKSRVAWRLSTAWILIIFGVETGFYAIGANAYSRDVEIIETEMVATAKWIDRNTDSAALVAAHDIGAMGYFGNRNLVDLAGLISPEVIPFIRDEDKLIEYLNQQKINYLVVFPEWYKKLPTHGEKIFQTDGKISISAGGENMAVYKWIQ
jgi:hypothetical protein